MTEAVIGIVYDESRTKVLLIKRRDIPIWVLPGGGIEKGELPEEAVIRELFEETGLRCSVEKKVGEYTPINKLAGFTYVFECCTGHGNLSTGLETLDICFWELDNLPESFFIVHHDWLKDSLLRTPGVLKKHITRVTYSEVARYFLCHPIQVFRYLLSAAGLPINTRNRS